MAQTKKELPVLRKQSDIFKIVVPVEVEEKIRHLCRCCPTVEWSGKLFYKTEGSIINKDLVITCVDLYVMDIGTGGYTEFDETPDYFGYMVDKDLMDCNIGLIHSHNNMATFFSGTDTQTLREEGDDNNHFVSLIVNNAGSYTAAVTRKVMTTMDITATKSFKTFDDSEINIEGEDKWQQIVESIEYYMLDVEKADVPSVFNELDIRLEEIRKAKEEKGRVSYRTNSGIINRESCNSSKPLSLFPERELKEMEGLEDETSINNSNDDWLYTSESTPASTEESEIALINEELVEAGFQCSERIIEEMTLQLVTGSIALTDTSKTDVNKFVNNMEALFDKRFNKDYGLYSYWMEGYFDFLLEERIPEGLSVDAENSAVFRILEALYTRFQELPVNEYISSIIEYIEIKLQ